ncbi:Ral interacting protein [Carabus blaptoides fortunei]
MDFESPDVMKDFPGLYATDATRKSNDSDYSDDVNEKITKKDLLIGKRKDKKDTKKDRGYAALEGESSAEEDYEAKSPSKSKKTKSFKFTTKNKEKREKVRDKEKDVDKKKDKDNRKNDRCKEKVKCDKKDKKVKSVNDEKIDISDVLPIFGVSLQLAVERSRCHDGIDLPLPVRNCIDYVQEHGISVENVYKLSGIKTKVLHIRKMYNQRELVTLSEYDVPTATSVLKLFFRELPEPILAEFLSRFEEAAAIQNVRSREISLLGLVDKLPVLNRILLAWTMLHLDNVTFNEKQTKMNAQSIAMALSPVLQMSHRLLSALLCHCKSLFKDTVLFKYCPPLISTTDQLPELSVDIMCELRKQESLLSQIHEEMNLGFISKKREELLWEVQRMITQLKRKLRSIQKCHEMTQKSLEECPMPESARMTKSLSCSDDDTFNKMSTRVTVADAPVVREEAACSSTVHPEECSVDTTDGQQNTVVLPPPPTTTVASNSVSYATIHETASTSAVVPETQVAVHMKRTKPQLDTDLQQHVQTKFQLPDTAISMIQHQNTALIELKDSLLSQIAAEKSEIVLLKYCIANNQQQQIVQNICSTNIDLDKLDELMDLINKENKILQIKKTDLVREIMEQREACIYLQSKLSYI